MEPDLFSGLRPARPEPDELTRRMAGIGMSFADEPNPDANIEGTLTHASEVGVDGDLRALAVLATWFEVHHTYVNADRLVRVIAQHPSERVRTFWSAMASGVGKDRRFARLADPVEPGALDLLPVGTDFQIARRGEDERFEGTALRVPAGIFRRRASEVLPPEALARLHRGYRNRVQMGPTWRADVWTVLERTPDASVAEVARRAYCAFGTAWLVTRDFNLLRSQQSRAPSSALRPPGGEGTVGGPTPAIPLEGVAEDYGVDGAWWDG